MCISWLKNKVEQAPLSQILEAYSKVTLFLEKVGLSILVFLVRIWMARIFWYSGLTKISSWESTLYLFEYEYKVPFLPIEFAAYSATAFELACPVFLVIGLFTRFATLPLIVMTAVIQFTYLDATDHYHWAMLLMFIFCYGPGKISLDNLLKKFLCKKS